MKIPTRWSPPRENVYKINAEVAGTIQDKWAIGTVIRDSEGYVMVVATWKIVGLPDVDIAEALRT